MKTSPKSSEPRPTTRESRNTSTVANTTVATPNERIFQRHTTQLAPFATLLLHYRKQCSQAQKSIAAALVAFLDRLLVLGPFVLLHIRSTTALNGARDHSSVPVRCAASAMDRCSCARFVYVSHQPPQIPIYLETTADQPLPNAMGGIGSPHV